MKFYPYSKVKTNKLGLLLFAGRAVTIVGFVWFGFTILIGSILLIVGSPGLFSAQPGLQLGSGALPSIMFMLWGFIAFLSTALAGGIAVGIVAMENHLSNIADSNLRQLSVEPES